MNESPYEALLDVCVASAMSCCRSMTSEQLNELLQNPSKVDSLIHNLAQVRSLPTDREALLSENKSFAEWNLAQEPRLEQLKDDVRKLSEQAIALKTETENLKRQLDVKSSTRSLDTTSNLLRVAAQEADDDAEAIAREFYDGAKPVDIFLKQFMEKKTVAHLRHEKSKRLMEVMRDQQYQQPAPKPAARTFFPQTTPYPQVPMNQYY